MIKGRLETEFSGPDLQAYFCIEMKPRESTVSRGKKYEDGKKMSSWKKEEKGSIMGPYTEAKSENRNSVLQWTRMYLVTVYTLGEQK